MEATFLHFKFGTLIEGIRDCILQNFQASLSELWTIILQKLFMIYCHTYQINDWSYRGISNRAEWPTRFTNLEIYKDLQIFKDFLRFEDFLRFFSRFLKIFSRFFPF